MSNNMLHCFDLKPFLAAHTVLTLLIDAVVVGLASKPTHVARVRQALVPLRVGAQRPRRHHQRRLLLAAYIQCALPRRTTCSRTGATAASTRLSSSTAPSRGRPTRTTRAAGSSSTRTTARRRRPTGASGSSPSRSRPAPTTRPRSGRRHTYLYCGSSLYGNLSLARVREWMAYDARFFGPRSHFVFHDAGGVGPAVRGALEPWVRAGRATLQDVRAQAAYDGWYYNQFLVVNDCLHRYRHAAKWTFFFDVDEYIFLPDGRKLEDVLAELEPYTQFTIEQNPMSSRLCVRDPNKTETDYSK
jgi:hypothetical protein